MQMSGSRRGDRSPHSRERGNHSAKLALVQGEGFGADSSPRPSTLGEECADTAENNSSRFLPRRSLCGREGEECAAGTGQILCSGWDKQTARKTGAEKKRRDLLTKDNANIERGATGSPYSFKRKQTH